MDKKDDTYGILMALRSVPTPPVLHWKCRLPENQVPAGLTVSPCGHYTVAGATSGSLYLWSSIRGSLLRTVKAHYRSVTALSWSDCGAYLVTGGADGMVHAFSLMDLVDRGLSDDQSISPVRTWSAHHLPVTCLHSMPSSRMISASEDGQIVLMELFSEITLMTLQLDHGIQSLTFHDGRIYAGSFQGIIFTIDVDVFAMQQTAQLGVTIKRRRKGETCLDQIYVKEKGDAYKSELCGHEKGVTALAILAEDTFNVWLVSGDESGTLRVWDLATRGCVRVIQPWSHSVRTSSSLESASPTQHPITAILVVPHDQDDQLVSSFSNRKDVKEDGVSNLVTPLQRFSDQQSGKSNGFPVPFLASKQDSETLASWDSTSCFFQPTVQADCDNEDENEEMDYKDVQGKHIELVMRKQQVNVQLLQEEF